MASPAIAADPASDFTYTVSGGSATITGYVGGSSVVDIPSTIVDGGTPYPVVAIGVNAFRGNALLGPLLTSVTIPDSVVTIGDSAFRGNDLTSVIIPDSVISISTYVFYNNALNSLTIGNSVATIGNNAFRGNLLTSVTIPDSVTSIGNNTFASNALTSVTIPDSVTSMGNGAFASNALTSVIFAGAAPTTFTAAAATTGSFDAGVGLTVYYYSGASGFSSPWNGYITRTITAAESELSIIPAGPITVGTTPYALTVTVRDNTSTPVGGVPVAFTIPSGVTASATGCTTTSDGTCAITVASSVAGTYLISAAIGADPAVLTQDVAFAAAPVTTPIGSPTPPAVGTGPGGDPTGSTPSTAAITSIARAPVVPAGLAFTGSNPIRATLFGAGMLLAGALLYLGTALIPRRRNRHGPTNQ